jgi:glycosyltransferase involved in cell wall biosynthesis
MQSPTPLPADGLSVVIPVYNSEASLTPLVEALAETLPSLGPRFEVILVNDASRDNSWAVVRQLAQRYAWVQGLDLMRNFGQHNALLCGIRAARYDVIVTMDDDLQHPPAEIGKLLALLGDGYDVVYGAPLKLPHSPVRNWLSKHIKRGVARATGLPHIADASAFRVFRAELRQAFADYRSPNLMLDALLGWGTSRFGVVRVNLQPRTLGRSNYNFMKLFNQTMLLVVGFTTGPLRLASVLGLGFALLGVVVFIYVVVQYLRLGSVPGFPFLASIVALFSGAQLFALGIIGEYLARVFSRNLDRPTYVVRTALRPTPPPADELG